MNGQRQPDYIVVEGPIGVGKTSLAKRLAATFKTDLMLELPAENPFLERFYEDPETVALPTQLYFLLLRAEAGEDIQELASWWTAFQEEHMDIQLNAKKEHQKKRFRHRPRRFR